MRAPKLLLVVLPALLLVAACGANEPPRGTAVLRGNVSVGPACPVDPCDGHPPISVAGHDLLFEREDAQPVRSALAADGSFSVELVEGDYRMWMTDCTWLGCQVTFPYEFTIRAGQGFSLEVEIDSGMRAPGPVDEAATVEFIGLLEEARDALANIPNAPDQPAAVEEVLAMLAELTTYTDYFEALPPADEHALALRYADQILVLQAQVEVVAQEAAGATGDARILAALREVIGFRPEDNPTPTPAPN